MKRSYYKNNIPEQNQIIFRTKPGAVHIPAGETIRLTACLPKGVLVAIQINEEHLIDFVGNKIQTNDMFLIQYIYGSM